MVYTNLKCTDKNVAISGMYKPKMHQQKCNNQWHAETLNNEYRLKNVETSDAQIQKKIGICSFVHMKENTTTAMKATEWNYYKATGDGYHTHKKCIMK